MRPKQIEVQSLTGYENTPLSFVCSAHTLDWMLLSVWPSFYTRLKLKCNISLQRSSQRVQPHVLCFSDTELHNKLPWRFDARADLWVQLNRPTRRIWGSSASEPIWITFPLLLECQCISVRGCWLVLHNSGTDAWPLLQITTPMTGFRYALL